MITYVSFSKNGPYIVSEVQTCAFRNLYYVNGIDDNNKRKEKKIEKTLKKKTKRKNNNQMHT